MQWYEVNTCTFTSKKITSNEVLKKIIFWNKKPVALKS